MRVILNGKKAEIFCTFQEKEIVKAIGNYRFNKDRKCWEFPLSSLIPIIENLNIEADSEVITLYYRLKEEKRELQEKIEIANRIKNGRAKSDMWEWQKCFIHQKQALAIASIFPSYALYMETGTGKTLVAIRLIEYWKVPTMVVAPLSILDSVWGEELKKWSSLKFINLWKNLKEFDRNYDVYLLNYEHLKKLHKSDHKIEDKIKFLIIDESSKMKNHNSAISKTILYYKDKIPHRLILSGKPAPNSMLEFWSQMEFIQPDILG